MPYIKQQSRDIYKNEIDSLVNKLIKTFSDEPTIITRERAGTLNYLFTTILKQFYGGLNKKLGDLPLRYADYNEMIGMLECCKQELYRRSISEYENVCIRVNGDV